MNFFQSTFKFLAIALIIIGISDSLKLNSDGGYEVLVAIDETSEPRSPAYLDELEGIFTSLSIQLYRASNATFYIKNVDILVPAAWTTPPDGVVPEETATTESFATSDIRISDDYAAPYVENPNICGGAGEFIQFPTSFFATKNQGVYGQAWKATLTQWARYRWGVWEEHGLPGDYRFPYFNKEVGTNSWKTTGCSNEEISGKYVNEFGETDEKDCNPSNEEGLLDTCRFVPSPVGNNATTSLMHFHFMESVMDFCDETNHDRSAPNKQNLFCGYKSVWEVIRETADFAAVTNPITDQVVPVVQFKRVASNESPVMYVLLDKGKPGLANPAGKLALKFSELFNKMDVQNTLTTLATFPSKVPDPHTQEEISWTPITSHQADFIRVTREPVPVDAPTDRDFGRAILEAIETIKQKNAPGGAVLVIVKTGAGKGTFDTIAYEEDVRGALLNTRIKLAVAELESDRAEPYVNLDTVANWAGGIHKRITGSNIDSTIVEEFIAEIQGLLATPVPVKQDSILIFKGPAGPPQTRIPIYFRSALDRVDFTLTVPNDADIVFSLQEGVPDGSRPEWNETQDAGRRKIWKGYVLNPGSDSENGTIWNFEYKCYPNCPNLIGQLVIYGTLKDTPVPDVRILDVVPYTSALNGVVDLNETKDSDTPFSIFARASQKGEPVANLTVEALIRITGGVTTTIQLKDDGLGSPDLAQFDGIYSGTFIPPADGNYKISVRVSNDVVREAPPSVRLLPIDQNQLVGCATPGCKAIGLSTLFQTTVDLPAAVSVINANTFKPGKPSRINDLVITYDEPSPGTPGFRCRFTSPALVGAEEGVNVLYSVYIGNTLEEILAGGSDLEVLLHEAKKPGEQEDFKIQFDRRGDTIFIGIITSNNNELQSEMSNIRGDVLRISSPPTVSTEPTPTTPETPPTSSTTEATTPDPGNTDSTSSETPVSAGPSTEPPDATTEEPSKPFFETVGGILTIVAIVLVVLAVGGGIFYYCYRVRGCYNTKEPRDLPERPLSRQSRLDPDADYGGNAAGNNP